MTDNDLRPAAEMAISVLRAEYIKLAKKRFEIANLQNEDAYDYLMGAIVDVARHISADCIAKPWVTYPGFKLIHPEKDVHDDSD